MQVRARQNSQERVPTWLPVPNKQDWCEQSPVTRCNSRTKSREIYRMRHSSNKSSIPQTRALFSTVQQLQYHTKWWDERTRMILSLLSRWYFLTNFWKIRTGSSRVKSSSTSTAKRRTRRAKKSNKTPKGVVQTVRPLFHEEEDDENASLRGVLFDHHFFGGTFLLATTASRSKCSCSMSSQGQQQQQQQQQLFDEK